ncbi:carboxymuconolactone decarboxylase family protein [Hydrogenimonas sp.]|uniref:carboxymuconolactone decarboxylase family protein n=1 Tax=Hydrogenimonas sp. TaxID=2231112 RepID=UPI0026214956|nr:carboxymuconolactone decarboxylase family protein [Hydrogenimonas sp.]
MAYIDLPEFEEMDSEIQERARPILEKTGTVGEIFKLLAVRKDIYFATDEMVQNYLLKETELPYRVKEAIALLVSKENGCKMCVDVHKNIAKMLGLTEDLVEQILQGIDAMDVPEKEKKLLRFSLRAAQKDNYKMTRADIDALKRVGYTDSQIIEAVAITGYFNYINTLSNVFGLGQEK